MDHWLARLTLISRVWGVGRSRGRVGHLGRPLDVDRVPRFVDGCDPGSGRALAVGRGVAGVEAVTSAEEREHGQALAHLA